MCFTKLCCSCLENFALTEAAGTHTVMLCLPEDLHCAQVEVQEPEAYMYDGEYERKAAELGHSDLISIEQSQVSDACLMHVFLAVSLPTHALSTLPSGMSTCRLASKSGQLMQRSAASCTSTMGEEHLLGHFNGFHMLI